MFDGIIIGSTTGGGGVPNLQQVTDQGDTTTNAVHAQRLFISDSGTGGEVVMKSNTYSITFAETPYEVILDFNGANGVVYGVKTNTTGNLVSDANIKLSVLTSNSYLLLATTIKIPHGLTATPTAATVTAADVGSMNAISGGYWVSWDATFITVHLSAPTAAASPGSDFIVTLYTQPA